MNYAVYMTTSLAICLYLLSTLFSGCNSASAKETSSPGREEIPVVRIYGASGARLPLERMIPPRDKTDGIKAELNFASSGTLARQIESGAPADLYLSASREWIDFLVKKGHISRESITPVAGNTLVLITRRDMDYPAPSFSRDFDISSYVANYVAIGDPAYVPVGRYTKEAFENLGWYNMLKGKLVKGRDVASVLHYVESGAVDFGVVYRSEAVSSPRVKVVAQIPAALHQPIVFYLGQVHGGESDEHIGRAANLISGDPGRIFEKHGFSRL